MRAAPRAAGQARTAGCGEGDLEQVRTGRSLLLNRASWTTVGPDDVRGDRRPAPGRREEWGAWWVDETGFRQKEPGRRGCSAVWKHAGEWRTASWGVFLAIPRRRAAALIDGVDLPKSWTDDSGPLPAGGVPDDVQFASKADLALATLGRAWTRACLPAGRPRIEAYGKDGKFPRLARSSARASYVVADPKSQAVAGDAGKICADAPTAHARDQAWKRRSCGRGSKGPGSRRLGGRHAAEDGTEPPGWSRYLLVRRPLTRTVRVSTSWPTTCAPPRPEPPTRSSSASPGPAGPSRSASRRPRTRPAFTTTRSVATTPEPPRHPRRPRPRLPRRHRRERPKSPGSSLIPVTLAQVCRLRAHLTTTTPSRAAAWAWSTWQDTTSTRRDESRTDEHR